MQDNGVVKALALATQLGFAIACPMVVFIGGGSWMDNRFGTTPWLLFLGIFLGIAAAGGAFYQILMLPARKRSGKGVDGAPYKVERKTTGIGTSRADKRRRNGR